MKIVCIFIVVCQFATMCAYACELVTSSQVRELRAVFKFKHKCLFFSHCYSAEKSILTTAATMECRRQQSTSAFDISATMHTSVECVRPRYQNKWKRFSKHSTRIDSSWLNVLVVRAGETCSGMATSMGLHFVFDLFEINTSEALCLAPKATRNCEHERGREKMAAIAYMFNSHICRETRSAHASPRQPIASLSSFGLIWNSWITEKAHPRATTSGQRDEKTTPSSQKCNHIDCGVW